MSARNPTFIVKNGEGSSYLFRTIIPKDIRSKFYKNNIKSMGLKEIRISLLTGLKSEAKHLAQVIKIKADSIFEDIRSGNKSGYCVEKIKAELKAQLYQIKTNGHNGERVNINEPQNLFQESNFNYYRQPMEQKLAEDYIRRLKFQDYESFCESYDIEFNAGDYPKKGALLKRRILSKKVGEVIGYREFAMGLAVDILNEYLPSLDFETFKDFFSHFDIDDEQFDEILDPLGDMSIEQLISLLEEEYDIIAIAKKIGVHSLFIGSGDVYENDQNKTKEEPLEKVWNGLKTNGTESGNQISVEGKTQRETSGNGKKLSAVFGEYIEEMKTAGIWNPKSELEKRASLMGLVDIIGDLPISKISFDIGRAYKQTLMKLPANRNKKAQYRDLKIEEILELEDVEPMSVRTVNNNLATVIAFMNWAQKQGYVKSNFFEGLKLPITKNARDERKKFSDADLKRIFDPHVYTKETAGNDFRYWVPLLGLYTGARINEICQLHVGDIIEKDGLWCMDINSKSDDKENPKRLKNKSSERLIPLHDKLIELGFIDFVNKQRKSKAVRLFPDLYYNINDGHSRKAGRWFNSQYLRKKLGISDPAKSFHSFRHTVADRLKQLGIAESFISELLGHSSGDTMSFGRYGKRYQPKVLMEEVVQCIEFDIF